MNRDALHVTKPERINLRMGSRAADERIVFRNGSVGVDAQHLAHVAVECLGLRPVCGIDAITRRDRCRREERAIRRLNDTTERAFGVQENLHIFEPFVVTG